MLGHAHRSLLQRLASVDVAPDDNSDYSEWLKAERHLVLMNNNALEDELIIYASSNNILIHGVIVSEDALSSLTTDELLEWNGNPFVARSGYGWGGASNDVRIVEYSSMWPSISSENFRQLIFARIFHGLNDQDSTHYEILQEYLHASEIFWRPEQQAFCCFDEHGDFKPIVAITRKTNRNGITLITFQRKQLEQYLAASSSALVRMFDFTLIRRGEFDGWPDDRDDLERTLSQGDELLYRQMIDSGKASYTRGVQIVRPSRPKSEIFSSIRNPWHTADENPGVEFIAFDFRNDRLTDISTSPSATTNYFQGADNSLPYETSPAFFRPDVLLKYKGDREKYTVNEELRMISCRGAWDLQTYDVNDEGQIFTYICYLSNLPYEEQLYWRSCNVEPTSGISERAFQNDFKGEWSKFVTPLERVLHIVREWSESALAWWQLRGEGLLGQVNTPRTTSRDEWGRAFSDLAKLVVEGFHVKAIRSRLEEAGVEFDPDERSLKLLERFLLAHDAPVDGGRLASLRTVQEIRSKVYAHYGGRTAQKLAADALMEHGSYTAHFESVCEGVAHELETIEKSFS